MFVWFGLDRWFWKAGLVFIALRWVSLCLHFLGLSPYGGLLTSEPERLLFHALFFEAGFLGLLVLLYNGLSKLVGLHGKPAKILFFILASSYLGFAQFDLEVVRWLGEHISLTFLRNYFHKTEGNLLTNLLWSDRYFTGIAACLVLLPWALSPWLYKRTWSGILSLRATGIIVFFCTIFIVGAWFINPSEKRMRRVCPVGISLSNEIMRDILGLDKPQNPLRARADLMCFVRTGKITTQWDQSKNGGDFPFMQKQGPGLLASDEWRQQPLSMRPNIVLIVMESWRAWNTGLVREQGVTGAAPDLDSVIENESYYFPFVQSQGFPSVEGSIGIHLGIWPHPRNIFASSYAAIGSQAWTEILRDNGYRSEIFLGFDPAFSNMLGWYRHWYDRTVFEPKCEQDGPLLDSLVQRYRKLAQDSLPFVLTTWTNTTHPPYRVPTSSGVTPAQEEDARFVQALHYSGHHVVASIDSLKAMPEWSRTIVILVGDHAQPVQKVRQDPSIAGSLTPGHTWVPLAILGGWQGIPAPRRNEEVIPQMDLAPTILEMLNVSAPHHFMGQSLLHPKEREFPCFRFGEVNLVRSNRRLDFRLGNQEAAEYRVNRQSNQQFGLLPGHGVGPFPVPMDSLDIPRYTDMFYSYGLVLDEDRLFPHRTQKIGVYEHRE